MKALRSILLVLFAASAVAGGVFAVKESLELRRLGASALVKERRVQELGEQITEVNFKYRGLMDSMSNVPDSLKTDLTGSYMKKTREYRKRLFLMERNKRETERLLRKDRRALAEVRARLLRWLLVFGGAAVVCLAASLLAGRAIRS
jgi:hypothetical protein